MECVWREEEDDIQHRGLGCKCSAAMLWVGVGRDLRYQRIKTKEVLMR